MPKTKTSAKTTTPATTSAAPVKTAGAAKTKKVAAPTEVVETPVVVQTTTVVPDTIETVELVGFEQAFKDVVSNLTVQMSSLKSALTDVRRLEKRVQKELKEAKKGRRKRRNVQEGGEKTKRQPSGFAKPSELSDELCGFLGVKAGTMMARTEVTKHITKYIKDHQLQDPSYKRRILCDSALGSLLAVKEGDEVTYFNLQSFMKPHFPKSAANLALAQAAGASN
mgnify:CR=1 FL=1